MLMQTHDQQQGVGRPAPPPFLPTGNVPLNPQIAPQMPAPPRSTGAIDPQAQPMALQQLAAAMGWLNRAPGAAGGTTAAPGGASITSGGANPLMAMLQDPRLQQMLKSPNAAQTPVAPPALAGYPNQAFGGQPINALGLGEGPASWAMGGLANNPFARYF